MTVAILFLAHRGVHNAAQWEAWRNGCADVTFHVLCEKPDHGTAFCQRHDAGEVPTQRTQWAGPSIVKRTAQGYGRVLERDPAATHVVLCSGACYPIRPAAELVAFLHAYAGVDLFSFVRDEEERVGEYRFRPHTQWCVLSRASAAVVARFTDWTKLTRLRTRLEVERAGCQYDEWTTFAIATAPHEWVTTTHAEWGPESSRHPLTWTDLDTPQQTHRLGVTSCAEVAEDLRVHHSTVFFMRKVADGVHPVAWSR